MWKKVFKDYKNIIKQIKKIFWLCIKFLVKFKQFKLKKIILI